MANFGWEGSIVAHDRRRHRTACGVAMVQIGYTKVPSLAVLASRKSTRTSKKRKKQYTCFVCA